MNNGYLYITDYVLPNLGRDVADDIQRVIENNPNRTIFFPDGEYLISHPICTPAHPCHSVDLQLSAYATIRATEDWDHEEAMIRLGAIYPANDIRTPGSNYSLTGGIIDGRGLAKGVSIDGGRETAIRNVSIKHVKVGIHIKRGANSSSSDADIVGTHIVGTGDVDSIGVILEGYDNTLTDMRIANVFIGVDLRVGGNFLRYIHPLYTSDYTDYENSCAFRDHSGNNWYNQCYSDQFGIGFRNTKTMNSIYDSCYCFWYSPRGGRHVAFKSDGAFGSTCTNFKADFRREEGVKRVVLDAAEPDGHGVFDRLMITPKPLDDDTYLAYVRGDVI